MYGYAGKLLFVDLTNGKIEEEELTQKMADTYMGGYGIGAKILLDRMAPNTDAFGPDSLIGFIAGSLNQTGATMCGRYTVVSKSPVTQGFNDANSGGFFGNELKKSGFDAVFVRGISEKPVYIWINDGKAEIRDASKLWGLDTKEVWEAIKEDTDEPKVRVAAIGQAGENLSLFAAIMNDGHRAAGRGGSGAVMGSKKLKAIAVRGTGTIELADKEKLTKLTKEVGNNIKNAEPSTFPSLFKTYGTSILTGNSALSGDSPVRNWGGVGIVDFGEENAKKVSGDTFDSKYKTKKYACGSCLIGCGAEYSVTDGKWPVGDTERPEYETLAAFGCNCLNSDVEAIIKCNEICNRAGLDTISAGSTVAWVMECYEHGILTKEDLDGIEAVWGNYEAMVALTEKMAKNEGCGKILALGQQGAADKFGKGHEYVMVAKGIEPGMHDARLEQRFSWAYQYDPTPGRHVKGGTMSHQDVSNAHKLAFLEVTNCSGACMFADMVSPPNWLNVAISAVTGKEFTPETAYYTGLRQFMLRHAFNIREGLRRKDFTISPRMMGNPPLAEGPLADVMIPHEKHGDVFFESIGCDKETGIPSKEILEKIGGLENVIEMIYGN